MYNNRTRNQRQKPFDKPNLSNTSAVSPSATDNGVDKTRFYKRRSFWCLLMALIVLFVWLDAVGKNPGCPDVHVMEKFDMDHFFGRWYQMFRTEHSVTPGQTGDCVISDLTLRSDYLIKLENSGVGPDGMRKPVTARARWTDVPRGRLEIKYGAFAPWSDYKVLETDYSTYAVVHSCQTSMGGAVTEEDTQVLVRKALPVDSVLWNRQASSLKVAIKQAFLNKEEGKLRADFKNYFKAVKQMDGCQYPDEPTEPDFDNNQQQ